MYFPFVLILLLNIVLTNGMPTKDEQYSTEDLIEPLIFESAEDNASNSIEKRNVFSFMWMNKEVKNKFIEDLLKEYETNVKLNKQQKKQSLRKQQITNII